MKVKREKSVYDLGEECQTRTNRSVGLGGGGTDKSNLFHVLNKHKDKKIKGPIVKDCQSNVVNQVEVKQIVKCQQDDHHVQTPTQLPILSEKQYKPYDVSYFDRKAKCSSYSDPNLHQLGCKEPFKNLLCPPPSSITSKPKNKNDSILGATGGDGNNLKKVITCFQNYYPEGGFGWIVVISALFVQILCHGTQLSFSIFSLSIDRQFHVDSPLLLGMLGALSMSTSLLLSPLWISLCKRKSTRLTGIFGGLIASLALLFTSFASQFHQLFLSYGIFLGLGVGLSRDASSIMVGQYFKRKRDLVEIVIVSGSGIGLIVMSSAIHSGISGLKWRLGLQAVTGSMLISFFLGVCYRSASLYHPQRRAILHLKNQRRKVKEKYKRDDSPPFFDFTCLKSKTLRILLLSSTLTSFGINVPLIYLSWKCKEFKIDEVSSGMTNEIECLKLHIYMGTSWLISCLLLGILVIQKNDDCRISKQYLCQGSGAICGLSIVLLTLVRDFNDLGIFVWVYGFSIGAYNYTLKIFTYDRATTRHFPRAWSFVQFCQGIPIFLGSIISGVILSWGKENLCFYLSAATTFSGSALLFLADVRRRNLARQGKSIESFKKTGKDLLHLSKSGLTFSTPLEQILRTDAERSKQDSGGSDLHGQTSFESSLLGRNLASISEEGYAEVDFQDIYFEDWEEMLACDAITSCDKVENCLNSEGEIEEDLIFPINVDMPATTRFLLRSGDSVYRKHRFNAIDGIGGPAMKVATGVIGIRPPPASSMMVTSLNKWKLCEIAESESFSSPTPTPACSENLDFFPHHSTVVQKHSKDVDSSSKEEDKCEILFPSITLSEIPTFESLQRKKQTTESHSTAAQESST